MLNIYSTNHQLKGLSGKPQTHFEGGVCTFLIFCFGVGCRKKSSIWGGFCQFSVRCGQWRNYFPNNFQNEQPNIIFLRGASIFILFLAILVQQFCLKILFLLRGFGCWHSEKEVTVSVGLKLGRGSHFAANFAYPPPPIRMFFAASIISFLYLNCNKKK